MTIVGTGIDLVDVRRIEVAGFPVRLAEYILRTEELKEWGERRDKEQFLASRLAAKEAIIKASPQALSYHDICIYKNGRKPAARLPRSLLPHARIFLSIAHEFPYATACAILTT